MNLQGQGNDNGQQTRGDASPQTRNISRLILFAKDERASDTTCIQKKKECVSVRLMMSKNHTFLLGWTRGVRFSLPIPPNPTRLALQNARFHCPRILFAWKDMTMTTFACTGAQKRNTPKYRTPLVVVQPMRESPMMAMTALNRI